MYCLGTTSLILCRQQHAADVCDGYQDYRWNEANPPGCRAILTQYVEADLKALSASLLDIISKTV